MLITVVISLIVDCSGKQRKKNCCESMVMSNGLVSAAGYGYGGGVSQMNEGDRQRGEMMREGTWTFHCSNVPAYPPGLQWKLCSLWRILSKKQCFSDLTQNGYGNWQGCIGASCCITHPLGGWTSSHACGEASFSLQIFQSAGMPDRIRLDHWLDLNLLNDMIDCSEIDLREQWSPSPVIS